MSNIRIIPPKTEKPEKKRTAAYCRVSSSSKEQLHSYAAQVKYYSDTLSADKAREFVGVYADEGITGTSAKKRPQFMAMIEDCRAGKIDAIITKSVSRFGRNTVDTLSYTRELKTLRIDVYFEKENAPPQPAAYSGQPGTEPLRVGQYIGMLLLMCVPILGVILLFVWSFGGSVNLNKKNYARAMLIVCAIGLILSIIFGAALTSIIGELLGGMGGYY